jgi:hypothetical protein
VPRGEGGLDPREGNDEGIDDDMAVSMGSVLGLTLLAWLLWP